MRRAFIVALLVVAAVAVAAAGETPRHQPASDQEAARFFVLGHVKTPGSYNFLPGMSVQQGIALAGGLTERGSTRGIKIQRMVDGNRSEIDARLSDAVQPNDTIVVRQRLQ